jgi:two-component system chemotaxis response regulator CheB
MSDPARTVTKALRVLVVDDSPVNRQVITEAVSASANLLVVGHASNGEQALRMVAELEPDAVSLDIEMPRMDGFTFLRILMATRPVPVIVLSSSSKADVVFRALEAGAVDFVAKPDDVLSQGAITWKNELVDKLDMIRKTPIVPKRVDAPTLTADGERTRTLQAAKMVVAVASSTGGPSALVHVLSRMPPDFGGAIVIAQHMAAGFTRTFAERLNRTTVLTVREAQESEPVFAGHVYVCPGGQCTLLRREAGHVRIRLVPPLPGERYIPSGNRLFASAAEAYGPRTVGLVLTGMANDGVEGARAIRAAHGVVIAESQESAVVYGMPGAVVEASLANAVLPLRAIADELAGAPRTSGEWNNFMSSSAHKPAENAAARNLGRDAGRESVVDPAERGPTDPDDRPPSSSRVPIRRFR